MPLPPTKPKPRMKTNTKTNQTQQAQKKQQQKLSQTRLDTPKKGSAKWPTATATKVKTPTAAKGKPNGSILNFFKRTGEEELFIEGGGGGGGVGGEGVEEDGEGLDMEQRENRGGEDVYGSSPVDTATAAGEGEERKYNEMEGSVKRRRLSGGFGAGEEVKPKLAPPGRKRAGNPFVDDDSDSDEDGAATPRVRSPPPPAFDDSTGRETKGVGLDELTNGTTVCRAPLLRRQTSGADFGDDYAMSEKRDGDDPFNDLVGIDAEDLAGEELRAMRYMEEQARLEAGEEWEAYEVEDDGDAAMTESCPVCNGSLAGATPDQATAHVNSCLDGTPTPLPKPPGGLLEADAAVVGKRFAKAAVARPGQANPISLGDGTGSGPSNSAFARLMSGHAEDTAWATAAAAETSSRGLPAYKRTCPFYKIMPGFSICVDAFRYGAVEGCQAYFLSHFHSDHYIGLSASWTHGPIYCSKITGSLVKAQLKTAAKYVVELEFEATVPVPETKGVTVTMIPANHCPGSSLFLFEKTTAGRTQRILHCGDFRACPAHIEHPKLRPETVDAITGRTKQQKIDVCYLDTTYLNPRYSFPHQDDVIQACAALCARLNTSLLAGDTRDWDTLQRGQPIGTTATSTLTKFFTTSSTTTITPPANPTNPNAFTALANPSNRLLILCGTYSIGKERLTIAIARALNTKIYAPPAKRRLCAQLAAEHPDLAALLTSDPAAAQVHMLALHELRADILVEYLRGCGEGVFGRVVGVRGSGWSFKPPASVSSAGGKGASAGGANVPPSSVPTTQLLHGKAWRPRGFGVSDMVPVRGATAEAMCFGVPYSEHSSFWELAVFVMALRIERVVPTVNVGSEGARKRMKAWLDRWVAERRRGGLVRVLEGPAPTDGEEGLWEGRDARGGGVYW